MNGGMTTPDSGGRIRCPNCSATFELSDALTGELRNHLREELEEAFAKKAAVLDEERKHLQQELEKRVKAEAVRLRAEATRQAQEGVEVEMRDLRAMVKEKSATLEDARTQELELRKKARDLEEKQRLFELEAARKLDEERNAIRAEAVERYSEEHRLKDQEKEKVITDLRRSLEEARRKAEQGSMETQGEVLELDLEQALTAAFPFDRLEPVPKGIRGADLVQRVVDAQGRDCGTLLWETKNTKNWTDAWVPKLKDDLVAVRANLAILVTRVLPPDVPRFAFRDGIWISDVPSAVGLAMALRQHLIALAFEKVASVGKNEKMEALYGYLAGGEFRRKIETIVETFTAMHEQLAREKRAMERLWKEREKQIERVVLNTSGMYGDIRGIAGASLPAIDALELASPPELPQLSGGEPPAAD